MAAQPKKKSWAVADRKANSVTQPMAAAGATTQTAGVRKLRLRSGWVRRSIMMASATMKKAHSVPPLEMEASWPTGKKAAPMVTPAPVMMVTICGVL